MAATAEYLKRLVDAAPPLTADQRARLAILLSPGPGQRLAVPATAGRAA